MQLYNLTQTHDLQPADIRLKGTDRFTLLAAINDKGSIAAAAQEVGITTHAAWDTVNSLNNFFPRPIVMICSEGAAEVTAEGLRALAVQRLLRASIGEIVSNLETTISGDPAISFPAQSLLWSPIMKTSARNTYHGVVMSVEHGAVNAEVSLKIAEDVMLTVVITERSVENLGITPSVEAYALIKASTPILVSGEEGLRTSARNCLSGTVISVEFGAVNSEVLLDIGNGKTLCAIVTDDSAEALDIQPGKKFSALIKASQIILAMS